MKKLLSIFALALILVFANAGNLSAQKVLVKEAGVSLSYSDSYVNTITCDGKKFRQYKITAYIENKSGSAIEIGSSNVSYCNHVRRTDAPCKDQGDCSANFFIRSPWPNDSIESKTFYVLVAEGDELPEPDGYLAPFKKVE